MNLIQVAEEVKQQCGMTPDDLTETNAIYNVQVGAGRTIRVEADSSVAYRTRIFVEGAFWVTVFAVTPASVLAAILVSVLSEVEAYEPA